MKHVDVEVNFNQKFKVWNYAEVFDSQVNLNPSQVLPMLLKLIKIIKESLEKTLLNLACCEPESFHSWKYEAAHLNHFYSLLLRI